MTLFSLAVGLIVLAALVYLAVAQRRPAAPEPAELTDAPDSEADPAAALFAKADGEPPTEDAIAQARLGGPRGAAKLGAAPMVPNEREQLPRGIDDGHVA